MGNWKFNEVVVLDLEATCWETSEETALNTSEIIEIGICTLDTVTGEIRQAQSIIVKPNISSISQFCEELTGITQDMARQGISFECAMTILRQEYGTHKKILAAYGNYDKTMLLQECSRFAIKPPIGPTYLNISGLASLKSKAGKRLSLSHACEHFGLPFEGRLHRGIDDAVMAAKILWEIIK